MTYGLLTQRPNGMPLIDPTLIGGRVYVGKYTAAAGASASYTFPNIPGHGRLRVLQIAAGGHSYALSTNGSGQAVITFTPYSQTSSRSTTVFLFTTYTTEPDYGVLTTNDAGQRTVSGLFPVPEFLGKVTFSNTPSSSYDTADGTYWVYDHLSATSLGAGRERLVLWSLPENTYDCWFKGTTNISNTVTGSFNLRARFIRAPTDPYSMPEAFVFALDGLTTSSDTYGIRVFDQSGNITFDSGRDHMVIKGFETTVDYPSSSGSTLTFPGLSTLTASNVPVMLIPSYGKDVWARITASSSTEKSYEAGVRRVGSTLYTRLVLLSTAYEDIGGTTHTNEWGVRTDLMQLVLDGALYGASNAALALGTSQVSGTAACSFYGEGTSNSVTCTSTSVWRGTPVGGNGSAITYSWSIVSNPGGLSISGSSTDNVCTVQKTASAPTSSNAVYTCTLRCAVSQSGSTPVSVDKTVTHTHSDTYSVGGGGGGVY
jgi:hypothetical protein